MSLSHNPTTILHKMKQLKMTCKFVREGENLFLVVSISRAPASFLYCQLRWSNGCKKKQWLEPINERKMELKVDLGVCRESGLFIVSQWSLFAFKLNPGIKKELMSYEDIAALDITYELAKRFSILCRARSSVALPFYTARPAPPLQIYEHSKADLKNLLAKARRIQSFYDSPENFLPCRWLYRHKPAEYFQEIFQRYNGLMKVYIKDNNGHPASCINGRLNGLFFSADVNNETGEPKWRPIYGNRRLRISCPKLFEIASNLYFADVYCMTSFVHHVTLVLTVPGSRADAFCSAKLVPLCKTERQQNPFLFLKGKEAYVSTKLMVEVFFTEDIDIARCLQEKEYDAFFDKCYVTTLSQRHLGRRKNPNCKLCNL